MLTCYVSIVWQDVAIVYKFANIQVGSQFLVLYIGTVLVIRNYYNNKMILPDFGFMACLLVHGFWSYMFLLNHNVILI